MKKHLTALLLATTMTLSLAACGKTETPTETTKPSTEAATEAAAGTEAPTEASTEAGQEETTASEFDFAQYFSVEEAEDKLVITMNKLGREWVISPYDENVTIETEDAADQVVYTITGANAGFSNFDIFSGTDTDCAYYYCTAEVAEDKKLNFSYTTEYLVYNIEPVAETHLDDDMEAIVLKMFEKLGDEAPLDVMKSMVDVSDSGVLEYSLGVASVDGLVRMGTVDPMMNLDTFAMSVLQFENADQAKAAAETLLASAPLNKWVCVSADGAYTEVVNDTYVVVIMGNQYQLDALK